MQRLILGTAVFAPGYGISKLGSILSERQGLALLEAALSLGIQDFDTAPSYGNAEKMLGFAKKAGHNFDLSTKISYEACLNPKNIENFITESLKRLQVSQIEILYLHDEKSLLEEDANLLIKELENLRKCGLFKKLGVSIYTEASLKFLMQKFQQIDVFQVPENICDRRLRESSISQEMIDDHREYIIRSVFLQGLLLMPSCDIPNYLSETRTTVESLQIFAERKRMTVLDLCLAYVRDIPWCNGILIGASSPHELTQIVESQGKLPQNWDQEVKTISEKFIDPRNWN
jgi:aryl-alcohol dehydrogenase-like predicted oxidoreductase